MPPTSTSADEFKALPQVFTINDFDSSLTEGARRMRITRWKQAGYIVALGGTRPQRYEKKVSDIVL